MSVFDRLNPRVVVTDAACIAVMRSGEGMARAAVELLGVSKSIGQRCILDRVSLQIRSGEFFALLGPSGCGKTTTLRLVAGFDRPTAGSIRIGDQDMQGVPPYRRDVNLVFQHYALFPHLTVRQNVAFGLEMQRLSGPEVAARTAEALELVRLEGLADRYPRQLSGGEQQRVALARAVVRRPSVLLLDEPLGALDRHLRNAMQAELKQLQRHLGLAFVYVTHDQEEALTMADRMAVMHMGRILQVGDPTELYERPTSRFVASFIGESNLFSGRLIGNEKEMLVVQLSHAVLQVSHNPELSVHLGDTVSVVIRPEKVVLAQAPLPGYENCLPITVEECRYLGADTSYRARLTDDQTLCARRQNLGSQPQFFPGERAYACFSRHGAHLLQETATL